MLQNNIIIYMYLYVCIWGLLHNIFCVTNYSLHGEYTYKTIAYSQGEVLHRTFNPFTAGTDFGREN